MNSIQFQCIPFLFTVKIAPVTPKADNKKPLSKLQKQKQLPNDKDNWELVPPDGLYEIIRFSNAVFS